MIRIRLLMPLACLLFAGVVSAADLKGKFVVDGDPPPPAPVTAPQAANDFPTLKLVYENVVVDPTTKGLANVLVYVRNQVAVTPEAAAAPRTDVIIDNKNGQFAPHATGLWVDKQKFFVKNSDPVGHNSNFAAGNANFQIPSGGQLEYPVIPASRSPTTGALSVPKSIACNVHPWMTSYILFADHPYVATSGTDGSFVIKDLPAGTELEIQFWHEVRGYLVVNEEWALGRKKITLPAEGLDLGEIKVPAELLTPKPQ